MNESAIEKAIDELAPTILRYIEQRMPPSLRTGADADDILQEVRMRMLERRSMIRHSSKQVIAGYLKRTADSILIDKSRKKNRVFNSSSELLLRSEFKGAIDAFPAKRKTPSAEARAIEITEIIHETIDTLPESQQEPVRLFYIERKSYEQIGEQLQLTRGAVQGLLRRGVAKLTERLKRRLSEDIFPEEDD